MMPMRQESLLVPVMLVAVKFLTSMSVALERSIRSVSATVKSVRVRS